MQVDFYHLAATPPERVIASLAGRLLADRGRLLVVARDEAQARAIDEGLWTAAPDSFLPHGRAGSADEARQPILIGCAPDAANGARNIALADGEWREAALGFDRVFHLFDEATVAAARAAWRSLAARAGIARRFWKQDERGRWTQAA